MTRRAVVCAVPALALAVALVSSACKHGGTGAGQTGGGTGRLSSVVTMSDPHSAFQLLSGFHSVEAGAWRWTERQFAISLARPLHAKQSGAALFVKLTVPPPTIQTLKSITLSATVGGAALPPETYTVPGDYIYRREVDAQALTSDPVRVDFRLDKAIPPGSVDRRELGVVVLAVGLEPR